MTEEKTVLACCHLLEGTDLKLAYHDEEDNWFFVCDQEHHLSQARELPLVEAMERFGLTEANLIQVPPGYRGYYYGLYWMMAVWEGRVGQVFRSLED